MGDIEIAAKKIRRRGQVQHALLTALFIGGMIALGAAPRVDIIQLLGTRKRDAAQLKYQINDALMRLARKGLVRFVERDGQRFARLTERGERQLKLEREKAALQLRKKKRWDKRWRVIIFDIPERRRRTRGLLRITMRECGFVRLQDSVWVYPHDCEELIVLLKADLKIGNALLYMVVEKVENDTWLKQRFSLK